MELTLSLPQTLGEYAAEQVREGGFATLSDYVAELVRRDREQNAETRLCDDLLEGLQSPSRPLMPEDWQGVKAAVTLP